MEEKTPMIYSAICGVMEDVGVVGKNDTNLQQKFKYRGIDAVMNALNPAMIKNKIFCAPEILEQTREERQTKSGGNLIYSVCKIRYRFFAVDGSFVDAVVVGEGMDSGDKASNKALSAGFKYACFQTFCIPTEELMSDPDRDTPEESTKKEPVRNNKKNSKPEKPRNLITEEQAENILREMERTGITQKTILYNVHKKSMNDLTDADYQFIMKNFEVTPDAPPISNDPPPTPPDIPNDYEGLPFA